MKPQLVSVCLSVLLAVVVDVFADVHSSKVGAAVQNLPACYDCPGVCPTGIWCAECEMTSGKRDCGVCPKGKHSERGVITCHDCPAGKASSTGSGVCSTCATGLFSTPGASECRAQVTPSFEDEYSVASSTECHTACATCTPDGAFPTSGWRSCLSCAMNSHHVALESRVTANGLQVVGFCRAWDPWGSQNHIFTTPEDMAQFTGSESNGPWTYSKGVQGWACSRVWTADGLPGAVGCDGGGGKWFTGVLIGVQAVKYIACSNGGDDLKPWTCAQKKWGRGMKSCYPMEGSHEACAANIPCPAPGVVTDFSASPVPCNLGTAKACCFETVDTPAEFAWVNAGEANTTQAQTRNARLYLPLV